MSVEELYAELDKLGCNVPVLKTLNLSYTELHDLMNGLKYLLEREESV